MTDFKMKMKNPRRTSETKKWNFEIKDFLKMIDNQEFKIIDSPKFTLGGSKFAIKVMNVKDEETRYIAVYLANNEDQTVTYDFKICDDMIISNKIEVPAENKGTAFFLFSFEAYKNWATENGDVFKLELTLTLHIKDEPPVQSPVTLRGSESFSESFGRTIMEDVSTADFTIKCDTKTFEVHRNVLCARSLVFRRMILGEFEEAKKGEVYVKEFDEGTLGSVITFIYTGELEITEDSDVLKLAWAGDKYNLTGFMELLCYKLQKKENLKPGTIADMLIASHRHNNQHLRSLTLEKIRDDRNIVDEKEFRERMKDIDINITFDLFKDL